MRGIISQHDVDEQFRDFALSAGIELPADLIADGQIHRFKLSDEKKGKAGGWYVLHLDNVPAGKVGSFKTCADGLAWKYNDPNYKPVQLTPEQQKQQAEDIRQNKERTAKEQAEKHAQAAIKARSEWSKARATTDADAHPYAKRKSIKLHHARLSQFNGVSQLIIPIQDNTGAIVSLQRINPDGEKRLFKDGKKSGCYSVLNPKTEPQIIAIAEGFATTASIIEDSYCVDNGVMGVMAIDAGNIEAVALSMRKQYPAADIFIFGDMGDIDDKGEKIALAAAVACGGFCVLPPIAKGDFNDYLTEAA